MNFSPIFIIGAGRSGTNILRDTLCSFPELVTWPCDEINPIFRHGNTKILDDEFDSSHARPEVSNFIRNAFRKLENRNPNTRIVEKTCANSLRIPFLQHIFPKAKYIFIVRNGYDVAASAKIRWTSKIELKYLLKKFQFVPLIDIPFYVFTFFSNRLIQFNSKVKQMGVWGPIYKGMGEDIHKYPLEEICALQWKNSVEKAFNHLIQINSDDVFFLTYEQFCNNPFAVIKNINQWLQLQWSDEKIHQAVKLVKLRGIPGRGKTELLKDSNNSIESIIEPVMRDIYSRI